MKRILSLAAVLLALAAGSAFSGEEAEVYRRIYLEAEGLSQKYAAAQNLVRLDDRSTAPVLAEALEELLRTQNSYKDASEKELYARTVRMLAAALGDYKHEESAAFLWDVVEEVSEPLAKAEALVALGKMRALAYAERISLMLRDLNMGPTADRDSGEKVAYGCVVALEKLKDPRGFPPVFYAADGWYSQRVRQQAERALPNILADPTDAIKELLRLESPERKVLALRLNASSRASVERKTEAAALALALGHEKAARDKAEARVMADLRKLALRSLVAYKARGAEAVPATAASYENGYDIEERLLALAALGANGGDAAATALRDVILKLDREQKAGVADETRNRLAKAAIENAGASKNRILRPALVAVASNDKWSGGIILAAQNAVKEIP